MASANVNRGRKKTEICGHCSAKVNEGICCDCCGFWVHYKCEGFSEEEARVWGKMGKRAKFYCSVRNCEEIAEHFINIVGPLKDQVDNNTKRIEDLEKRMLAQEEIGSYNPEKEITKAVSEVKLAWENMKEDVKEDLKVKVKDELQTVIEGGNKAHQQSNTHTEDLEEKLKVALEEEKDKEFRSRNLILLGVPEPDTEEMAVGKAADLENVTNLFSRHMKVDVSQYRITDTTRLHGGKNNRNYATDPRPLRVRFDSVGMIGKVTREVRHLSTCDDENAKKITIFRDRSKKERDERKKLSAEAAEKNREESDQAFKWIVNYRTMEVIRVAKEHHAQQSFRRTADRKYR